MPTKRGILDGNECEFPIHDVLNKKQKLRQMNQIQDAFKGFMQTDRFISWDTWEKVEKIKRAKKGMVFMDLPSKKSF